MRADEPGAPRRCKTAKILKKPYKTAVEKTRILWYYNGAASKIGRVAETGAPKRTWTAGGRAKGSLGALIVSSLGFGFWPQFITFVVLSAISMALLRPIARKLLKPNYSATNADRVLGTTGLVTEEINNIAGKGLVNLSGQVWSARSSQADGVIPAGQEVRVLKIQGVKVIVEPV